MTRSRRYETCGRGAFLFGRAGDQAGIAVDFVKEVVIGDHHAVEDALVRKGTLDDNVLCSIAQGERTGLVREVLHWRTVEAIRRATGEQDLMIILSDLFRGHVHKLRNDRATFHFTRAIKIRNVAHDQIIAVEPDGVAFVDQPPEIVVMTDQCLRH
jgi:hypothetical protein